MAFCHRKGTETLPPVSVGSSLLSAASWCLCLFHVPYPNSLLGFSCLPSAYFRNTMGTGGHTLSINILLLHPNTFACLLKLYPHRQDHMTFRRLWLWGKRLMTCAQRCTCRSPALASCQTVWRGKCRLCRSCGLVLRQSLPAVQVPGPRTKWGFKLRSTA